MTMTTGPQSRHMLFVERTTAALAVVVMAGAFVAASRATATAVAVGAGLMTLNAWALRRISERVIKRTGDGAGVRPGLAILFFNLKMAVLIALVYVCVKVLGLDAVGF